MSLIFIAFIQGPSLQAAQGYAGTPTYCKATIRCQTIQGKCTRGILNHRVWCMPAPSTSQAFHTHACGRCSCLPEHPPCLPPFPIFLSPTVSAPPAAFQVMSEELLCSQLGHNGLKNLLAAETPLILSPSAAQEQVDVLSDDGDTKNHHIYLMIV